MTQVEQSEHTGGNSVAEKRVDLAYNALGQFSGITRYADLAGSDLVATTDYAYDTAHRLTALSHEKGSTVLSDYAWAYDTAGRAGDERRQRRRDRRVLLRRQRAVDGDRLGLPDGRELLV
jgi:YD repeat-containing protein